MLLLAKSARIRRALLLATGQTTQYGGMADDGFYEIGEAHRYTILTAGQYAGIVSITLNGKTDTHSNACVMDDATGLMWSRALSASVGPTSNGLLPWTTNGSGEGVFAYCSAANAANLAGYSDWRVPNRVELICIMKEENSGGAPDSTAFPAWTTSSVWTSTTPRAVTANAYGTNFTNGNNAGIAKAGSAMCILVRGPIS